MKQRGFVAVAGSLGANFAFLAFMLVFVAGIVVSTGYTVYRLRAEAIDHQFELTAIQARAIEDHLTQSFNIVSQTLANALPAGGGPLPSEGIGRHLEAALLISPALRSISVLDAGQRIVASSNPANLGVAVDTADYLPPLPGSDELPRVGRPWSGRDFAGGSPAVVGGTPAAAGEPPGFIPVVRRLSVGGRALTLVAAINPDYFSNHYSARLLPEEGFVDVLRYDGINLLSTDPEFPPGSRRQGGAFLAQVSEIEFGGFEAMLHGDVPAISAFRASRQFPLVVVVHLRRDVALREWAAERRRLLLTVVPALLAMVMLISLLYVHLRRKEEAQAEARQRDRDRLAAAVFQTVDDAVIVTHAGGRIVAVNPAFVGITGYAEDEVLGKAWHLLASTRHSPVFFAAVEKALREAGGWHGEIWNRHKNGTEYIAWFSIKQVCGDGGELSHYVAAFSDITDRKQAEAAQIRAVIEASPEAVLLVMSDSTIGYANRVSERVFGYTPGEASGLDVGQLVPIADRARHAHYVREFNRHPHSRPMGSGIKLTARRKDGSEFPAEISLSPMQMGGEAVVIVAVSDITRRIRDEAALRASEERWKFALEGAGEGVWDWSPATGEALFSKRILDFWGCAENEAGNRIEEWTRRIHPDDAGCVAAELQGCLAGARRTCAVEHRVAGPDGQWKWALVRGMALGSDADGKPSRMIGTYADITERKKGELDFRAAKEAAEALLERASMAERRIVDISEQTQERIGQELHDDLGQHLTGAAFLSEILFRKLEAGNLAEQEDAAAITGLINAAVAKTRMLAQGLYPVELKEAGLRSMIGQLARNVGATYDIRCAVSCDDDFRIDDPAISINLFRIVQEAINNAVKHGKAKRIGIAMSRTPLSARLEIADDGCGLGAPAEAPGTPEKGGLGMHTMHYRAALIGADLKISSNADGGVTVVINLPAPGEGHCDDIQ